MSSLARISSAGSMSSSILPIGAVRLYQPKDCDGVSLAYWTKETAGEVAIESIEEGRPRITLTVYINGRPIEAMLDSGASTSVLTKEDAASLGVTPDTPGVVAGPSSGGLGAKGGRTVERSVPELRHRQ